MYIYKYVSGSDQPKYKAWLITKGFEQEHGVNYNEILSPIVKITTLRLLLRVVATGDLELEQLDVKIVGKTGPSGWRDKLNWTTATRPRPKNRPIPNSVGAELE